jgi:uncharacterized membrane protein required for colicin V production
MLLGFFTVVVMLVSAYAFWRQGVLSAIAMAVNVLLAGLIAFNFFEPMAVELDPMVADSILHGYEDSVCLVVPFVLSLLFLRWASNALIHTVIEYQSVLQQAGAVVFGALAGYLTVGFLLSVAQTLPLDQHFLHFEARIDPTTPGAKIRHILPPDRVWLALMHRASVGTFSWEDNAFDPDGSFEMRYARERRVAD